MVSLPTMGRLLPIILFLCSAHCSRYPPTSEEMNPRDLPGPDDRPDYPQYTVNKSVCIPLNRTANPCLACIGEAFFEVKWLVKYGGFRKDKLTGVITRTGPVGTRHLKSRCYIGGPGSSRAVCCSYAKHEDSTGGTFSYPILFRVNSGIACDKSRCNNQDHCTELSTPDNKVTMKSFCPDGKDRYTYDQEDVRRWLTVDSETPDALERVEGFYPCDLNDIQKVKGKRTCKKHYKKKHNLTPVN
ncbi:hypothetical protein [Phascolarctid gammaherpesvirus 1]|uniref:Uncharacterized protein n=1 Tax=Phascolarctid gammaherpesvirus 1 TaxID=2249313 RepID=A0A3S5HA12_9GAMA|nr:hypothetical protein KM711_gp02 [Phascolarctid gammaherpesvirus 1]AZB49178.1 hypothetical protein [Phascolarctid gammaherpesvirus 1]